MSGGGDRDQDGGFLDGDIMTRMGVWEFEAL